MFRTYFCKGIVHMAESFFSSTFCSTLVSLTSFLASFTLAFPCFGFIKQKQEQQGHWNKNFIAWSLLRSQIGGDKKAVSIGFH
ncbi:hypothetical protein ACSQ67_010270 [Phaseolus vulgaris]